MWVLERFSRALFFGADEDADEGAGDARQASVVVDADELEDGGEQRPASPGEGDGTTGARVPGVQGHAHAVDEGDREEAQAGPGAGRVPEQQAGGSDQHAAEGAATAHRDSRCDPGGDEPSEADEALPVEAGLGAPAVRWDSFEFPDVGSHVARWPPPPSARPSWSARRSSSPAEGQDDPVDIVEGVGADSVARARDWPQPQGRQGQDAADDAGPADGPAGKRHPRLIEDLKAFLGERVHSKQQVVTEPSLLASPYKSRPQLLHPRIMSSPDGQDESSEAGLGDDDPGLESTLPADCAPASPSASSGDPSPSPDRELGDGDGDGELRRPSRCSVHSHHHQAGPTSMEDKCLECCVYYGVMCCQCTIL